MIYDTLGIIGSLLVVGAYYMNVIGIPTGGVIARLFPRLSKIGKITGDSYAYLITNLIAAVLLGISLIHNFNPGSLIIEIFWSCISVYGLMQKRKLSKTKSQM